MWSSRGGVLTSTATIGLARGPVPFGLSDEAKELDRSQFVRSERLHSDFGRVLAVFPIMRSTSITHLKNRCACAWDREARRLLWYC